MHFKGFKIHVAVIALAIGLVSFLGANWLYDSLNFKQPLEAKLEQNQAITHYLIEENPEGYKIKIKLKETSNLNLMQSYQQVHREVLEVMEKRPFVIEFTDQRNDLLINLHNQGQFAIQEAIINGNFVQMARHLNDYADQAGVESTVYMDDQNIYWQLRDGKDYLFLVSPRDGSSKFVVNPAEAERR